MSGGWEYDALAFALGFTAEITGEELTAQAGSPERFCAAARPATARTRAAFIVLIA